MARRDLGNGAIPVDRAHMKRPLVIHLGGEGEDESDPSQGSSLESSLDHCASHTCTYKLVILNYGSVKSL